MPLLSGPLQPAGMPTFRRLSRQNRPRSTCATLQEVETGVLPRHSACPPFTLCQVFKMSGERMSTHNGCYDFAGSHRGEEGQ